MSRPDQFYWDQLLRALSEAMVAAKFVGADDMADALIEMAAKAVKAGAKP